MAEAAGMDRVVRRRQVFYIPGYDPLSPRRYRELYRTESARQAAISGYAISLQGLTGPGNYRWRVRGEMEGAVTETEVEFLAWNDIVKGTLRLSILGVYLLMLRTLGRYLFSGVLVALIRLNPGPMLSAFGPISFMLLYLVVAGLCGWATLALTEELLPLWARLALGLAVFLIVMAATRRLDPVIYTYYLICDYAYTAQQHGAYPPLLRHRLSVFADRIGAALTSGVDEVLLIGHSSGAHLGVSVLADLARRGLPRNGPTLSFLTIGQVIPMASFLPEARELRRDLHELAQEPGVYWLDVTSKMDGASFTLCDPVAVTGVAPAGKLHPKVISAAFRDTLSPARIKYLRWRYFARHFQYLCAFDHPGDYDYFRVTAGPATLAARFRARRPSPSRVERVLSPHRDF